MPVSVSRSRRSALGWVAGAALALGFASVAQADPPLVGAVQMVAEHEWFRTIELGMAAAAKDHGGAMIVANAQGQVDREAQAVDDMVARGVKAIVISALDSKASVPALQRATDAGVKLINYNSTIDGPLMTTFVGVDNTELGAAMGRFVAKYVTEQMGGKAKVALLTIPKYAVGRQRREGFVAEVKKVPGIEIVAEQEGELPEQAANTMQTILEGHPDLNIVWAANEGGLVGALTAKSASGANVKIFGTDMSLQVAQALLDPVSNLVAVSTQDPYNIGYKSMELAIDASQGKTVAGKYTIPLAMFYASDPDAVKAYLAKYKTLAKQN